MIIPVLFYRKRYQSPAVCVVLMNRNANCFVDDSYQEIFWGKIPNNCPVTVQFSSVQFKMVLKHSVGGERGEGGELASSTPPLRILPNVSFQT